MWVRVYICGKWCSATIHQRISKLWIDFVARVHSWWRQHKNKFNRFICRYIWTDHQFKLCTKHMRFNFKLNYLQWVHWVTSHHDATGRVRERGSTRAHCCQTWKLNLFNKNRIRFFVGWIRNWFWFGIAINDCWTVYACDCHLIGWLWFEMNSTFNVNANLVRIQCLRCGKY